MTLVTADMLGPTPHPEFRGNGMGTLRTSWLVRMLLWFARDLDLDVTVARYHDWGYAVGGDASNRELLDDCLWLNTRARVRACWTGSWRRRIKRVLLGRLLPWACYRVVRRLGWLAFEYETPGDRDRELVLAAKAARFGYRYGER